MCVPQYKWKSTVREFFYCLGTYARFIHFFSKISDFSNICYFFLKFHSWVINNWKSFKLWDIFILAEILWTTSKFSRTENHWNLEVTKSYYTHIDSWSNCIYNVCCMYNHIQWLLALIVGKVCNGMWLCGKGILHSYK